MIIEIISIKSFNTALGNNQLTVLLQRFLLIILGQYEQRLVTS